MSSIFFGTPVGIREEQCFSSKAEVKTAELHRFKVCGIDDNNGEGASSVLISGGCKDDEDWGDYIIYTGHGGTDSKTKKQVEDQSWDAPGNKGLVISEQKQLPVRVLRSSKHKSAFSPTSGYKYGGLYKVVDHWEEQGRSGFMVCRFKLVKEEILDKDYEAVIADGSMVLLKSQDGSSKWFSIGVDAPNAQRINETSKMAQLLSAKKVGESIDFGSGFEVVEIKKYLSK
uniref:YDG/SRA domain-containing protein n=1 Tax=uncultured Draconibacterium sp. TaxID=1573823 RepID=UPI00321657BB